MSETKREFPIVATAMGVWVFCLEHWRYAIRIAWPWLAILALVNLPSITLSEYALNPETAASKISRLQMASVIIAIFVAMAGWSSIAVLWHRHFLRGEDLPGWPIDLGPRARHYLLRFIFLLIIVMVPSILINAFSGGRVSADINNVILAMMGPSDVDLKLILASVFLAMVLGIVSLRLSISLPAAALGAKAITPAVAWNATSGNGIRLLAASVLAGGPAFVINWLVFGITLNVGWTNSIVGIVAMAVLTQAANFAWVMIGVTFLSLTYSFFIEKKGGHRAV